MNLYRIYPVLWNDGICTQAQTVYAIDRTTPLLHTCCSTRVKEDPGYYYESSHFQRLLPPADSESSCYQPPLLNAVTWQTLPAWLTYIQTRGYTLKVDLSCIKPYSDIYIAGP